MKLHKYLKIKMIKITKLRLQKYAIFYYKADENKKLSSAFYLVSWNKVFLRIYQLSLIFCVIFK